MKLTYLLWGYPHDAEIIRALKAAGLTVDTVMLPGEFLNHWDETADAERGDFEEDALKHMHHQLKEQLRRVAGDVVFSVNFFAQVSNLCQQEKIPYCSWILQLPNFDLYTAAVQNPCNYLGICDSYLVEKLWQLGVSKAFFLPDAIDLGEVMKNMPVEREFCFVARHPEQVLNTDGMTLYGKGYLDAFIHAQRVLYGASILENGLINRVYQEFLVCNPISAKILPEMQRLYVADKYFAPVCTGLQQNIFLQNYENIMTIYSNSDFEVCKAKKHSFVEDETERRRIFAGKEFTLILASHNLHNGIPRETLEVIVAGGFPISGFQKDYSYFFQKDENLVYFTNFTEFNKAIVRYGNNYEERERVKEKAYETVANGHTYQHRIESMLEIWGKL